MMKRPYLLPVAAQRGFTLLEILLAIVILGTVLSTIFASYTSTFRVINDIDAQLEVYQMARTALDRIVEDLESVYVPAHTYESLEESDAPMWHVFMGEENGINGEDADTLLFSSQAHVHFGPKNAADGTAMIKYYVEEAEETGSLVLFRSDRLLLELAPGTQLEDETAGFPLCEGLASVNFSFFDSKGEEKETWYLEEEETLPKMVAVHLEFLNPNDAEVRYIFSTKVGIPVSELSKKED